MPGKQLTMSLMLVLSLGTVSGASASTGHNGT